MSGESFVAEVPVRFGDVDYARIIYYPRFFHLLHIAFEELFARHVGIPYAQLVGERNLGFPAVKIDTEFHRPMRHGDVLKVAIAVPRIGRSSVSFDHRVDVGDEPTPRATCRMTRVAVNMDTLRAVPLPEDIRARLAVLRPVLGPADPGVLE